jgi:hypothetical protein
MNIRCITITGFLSAILVFCGINNVKAQEVPDKVKNDTLKIIQPGMDTTGLAKNVKSVFLDSIAQQRPKIAAYYAAALPGLGQIYNKDFWKLPIIYGGAITMGYFMNWNNHKYQEYLQAFSDKENGVTDNELANLASKDLLTQGITYYRRNRDFLMILMGGLYMLQIVDAHVQAHLLNFDVTEDLGLQFKPVLNDPALMSGNFGLGLVLTFKR